MKQIKQIVVPLTAILLAAGAQAQTKIAIEGQAYVINSTQNANVNGTLRYEWYRNNVLIPECTAATCTVPANLCNGTNIVFVRKVVATGGCAGDTEGFSNTVTVTFICGGGHGTKIGNVCWANRNVGAAGAFTATAHEYSPFYQFNRNRAWAAQGAIEQGAPNGWNYYEYDHSGEGWTITPHPCPTGWRLPTQEECEALVNSGSTWRLAHACGNAVAGRFFGPNHAACTFPDNMTSCVFLPASGVRSGPYGAIDRYGNSGYGFFWASPHYWDDEDADSFEFSSTYTDAGTSSYRANGFSIRCVQ